MLRFVSLSFFRFSLPCLLSREDVFSLRRLLCISRYASIFFVLIIVPSPLLLLLSFPTFLFSLHIPLQACCSLHFLFLSPLFSLCSTISLFNLTYHHGVYRFNRHCAVRTLSANQHNQSWVNVLICTWGTFIHLFIQ